MRNTIESAWHKLDATLADLRPGRGGTRMEVSDHTCDAIWHAAVRTITAELTLVEANRQGGILRAEKGAVELVGVFIAPVEGGAGRHAVEVLTLERATGRVRDDTWTPVVMAGIRARLTSR